MLRNFTRTPDDDGSHPIGALFAGIALLILALGFVIFGSAESVKPGYWVPVFFGVVMVLYGSAGLTLYRRPIESRPGGDDAP